MSSQLDSLFAKLRTGSSIASRLRFSFLVLVSLLIIPAIVSVTMMTNYALRYHALIGQVERVAALKQVVLTDIPDELWNIVAGNRTFDEGAQYAMIQHVNDELDDLLTTAGTDNIKELMVARRTMDKLLNYVNQLGGQIQAGERVAIQEETLEQSRGVSTLVGDQFVNYVDVEIIAAAATSNQLQRLFEMMVVAIVALLIITFAFSSTAQRSLSQLIQTPIAQLDKSVGALTLGDLSARAPNTSVDELQALTANFNVMAARLSDLIDENTREQENLKKSELRALQAQIAPHFLYNTLDAIVWLAEADRSDEVIQITRALSDFFRISLSQGKDWIPLSEEVKHLTGYLTIQKIRYRDILDYEIDIPSELHSYKILKLLIQPLVENAIYHGIKHRRGLGHVTVTGRIDGQELVFTVRDDGVGMTADRLFDVRNALAHGPVHESPGYGLFNVNQRIKLYYNQPRGIEVMSDEHGTTISLRVPIRSDDNV